MNTTDFKMLGNILLFLMFLYVSKCERRIESGVPVKSEQSYVVYLVKAELAGKNYDFWLCGGALVTVDFILTSAACVEDVKYLYAIAGYNKLVEDTRHHEDDMCISKIRKKVIYTCVPVSYQFDFDLLEKWSYIDLALVKVESPYDLEDSTFRQYCSYPPTVIPINYDTKYQIAGTDAMVLGWGHRKRWRSHGDTRNFNKEYLHYAPTVIMDKQECMNEYSIYPNMSLLIDNYMICTLEAGNIDENGRPIEPSDPTAKGCSGQQPLFGPTGTSCEEENNNEPYIIDNIRRNQFGNNTIRNNTMGNARRNLAANQTVHNYTISDFIKQAGTRRNGICQNDHGGPLVTWVGTSVVLIGIASVFKVTKKSKCIGPYLYTSTSCNGAFLDCVLNDEYFINNKKRRSGSGPELCDSPPAVKGFSTIERKISWKDHPDGPADNERDKDYERMQPSKQVPEKEKYPPPPPERPAPYDNYQEKYRSVQNFKNRQKINENIARVGPFNNDQIFFRPQRPLRN